MIAQSIGKALGEIQTKIAQGRNHGLQISHDQRIGGFNYLILERKSLRGSYNNKKAIIPPQRIKEEQLRI